MLLRDLIPPRYKANNNPKNAKNKYRTHNISGTGSNPVRYLETASIDPNRIIPKTCQTIPCIAGVRLFKIIPPAEFLSIKKAEKVSESGRKEVIKTWSRRSTILPQFVGLTFGVYNGQKFVPVAVSENMVGHKFGEFSPTRSFKGHTAADKKVGK